MSSPTDDDHSLAMSLQFFFKSIRPDSIARPWPILIQLFVPHVIIHLSCRARTPNTLQEAVFLRQPVQRVVALSPRPHKPAQRIHLVLARVPSVLVDLAHGDLDRGVVLGFDDAVCGGTFAGDIKINDLALLVLHCCGEGFRSFKVLGGVFEVF